MNVETARNDLPVTHHTFRRKKMQKLFLVKFRYRRGCVSVVMRPSGYFIRPHSHLALGAIWVWHPCFIQF